MTGKLGDPEDICLIETIQPINSRIAVDPIAWEQGDEEIWSDGHSCLPYNPNGPELDF